MPWGKKRDPRTDAYLIQREISLVQKVVSHLRADAGVFAWQLANEAFLSGFSEKSALDEWTMPAARGRARARPRSGPSRSASTPRRSSARPASTRATPSRAASSRSATSPRPTARTPPRARSRRARRPTSSRSSCASPTAASRCCSTTPGCSRSTSRPPRRQPRCALALWSGLANRAAGVLARRLRDLTTERREPYFLDPFETLVGLVDSDGELKPSFTEVRAVRAHRRAHRPRALRADAGAHGDHHARRALQPASRPRVALRRRARAWPRSSARSGRTCP